MGDGRAIKGNALFTTRSRQKGDVVAYYSGKVVPRERTYLESRARRFYIYLDDGYTMDGGTGGLKPRAGTITAYINSPAGCVADDGKPMEPNLAPYVDHTMGLGPRTVRMVALRDIASGEELFYDYGDRHDMSTLSPESGSEDEVYREVACVQAASP